MPSGKKSRQKRQAAVAPPPPVRSKGAPAARRANPKILGIAAGIAVVAAAAIILAVVLGGGGKKQSTSLPAIGTLTGALPAATDVHTLFNGIPQKGLTLVNPKAPVTLTEFVDLQCPYCQEFETQVMPDIINRYVKTGKVKVDARPIAIIGPDSVRGRNAMIALGLQNRAFNFAALLYDNQGTENTGWLNNSMVGSAAASIPGVRVHQALNAVGSSAVSQQGKTVDSLASAKQVHATPTLFLGKSGTPGQQVALQSPTDEQTLVTAIQNALAS
jgi:protein-disulfide isomerase